MILPKGKRRPSLPGFNLGQTFFGFNPTDRNALHERLWDMIWWGEGRWDWDTLYWLPIPTRKMFLNKLNEVLEVKFAKAENNGNIPEPLKKKKKPIAKSPI